jgi:hypothetical protein
METTPPKSFKRRYFFLLLISALIGTLNLVDSVTHSSFLAEPSNTISKLNAYNQSRIYRPRTKGNAPTTLFVIDTTAANYNSRIPAIRETYLKRIRAKDSTELIFVGSRRTDGSDDMFASTCKVGYWEDSCKRADMATIAYQVLHKPYMDHFDWIMFADDDAYLLPDNVQRMIQALGPTAVDEIGVWAIAGCVHDECKGICGGGGYLMNRKTLFLMQEGGDKTAFPTLRDETNKFDIECGRCGDLTIARVMTDHRHITIRPYPVEGIYVWNFKDGDQGLLNSLKNTNPLPWFYHYPARDRFHFVHEKATEFGSNHELED